LKGYVVTSGNGWKSERVKSILEYTFAYAICFPFPLTFKLLVESLVGYNYFLNWVDVLISPIFIILILRHWDKIEANIKSKIFKIYIVVYLFLVIIFYLLLSNHLDSGFLSLVDLILIVPIILMIIIQRLIQRFHKILEIFKRPKKILQQTGNIVFIFLCLVIIYKYSFIV
jgi:hypothetical protein